MQHTAPRPAHTLIQAPDATPRHTCLVLHGILGSRRNWMGYARKLAAERPDWRFVLADLRNHGDSHGFDGPHTLEACVEDLRRLMADLKLTPTVVMGHSFGGKVALTWGRMTVGAEDAAASIFVLDATPEAHPDGAVRGDVPKVIEGLRTIPVPVPDRQALIDQMTEAGFSMMLARWMTTNLKRLPEGGFGWKFDLDGVEAMLQHYFEADLWPLVEAPPPGMHIRFVRAGLSDRWTPPLMARFAALPDPGPVQVLPLEGAGHWVHVDDPDGLRALLLPWFDELS